MRFLLCIIVALWTASAYAQSARNVYGVAVHMGEGYGLANVRITTPYDIDFGLANAPVSMFYLGKRHFSDNSYVGYGVGASSTLAFYGCVGYEWRFSVFAVGGELNGGGDLNGNSSGTGTLSFGVLF